MAFVKGQSGNPTGRPKIVLSSGESLTDLARRHTAEAVGCLMEIIRDAEAPHAAKTTAALGMLDRGWGRPAQSVTIAGDAANPLHIVASLEGLNDEQLRALASIKIGDA